MYCPNQGCPDLATKSRPSEFRDGVSVCPACGTPLVGSEPAWATRSEEDGASVPCMTVGNAALLPHIKGILDGAAVRYFVKNDQQLQNLLGWGTVGLGYSNVVGPPVVMVDAAQLDLARELLRDLDAPAAPSQAVTKNPSRCAHCGKELESDKDDEALTHCYHCGWSLDAIDGSSR